MRDSDIDSLSADGAQEPYLADSAEALLREAAEPCTPSNPHAECRYANSGTRWHCYRAAAEGKEE